MKEEKIGADSRYPIDPQTIPSPRVRYDGLLMYYKTKQWYDISSVSKNRGDGWTEGQYTMKSMLGFKEEMLIQPDSSPFAITPNNAEFVFFSTNYGGIEYSWSSRNDSAKYHRKISSTVNNWPYQRVNFASPAAVYFNSKMYVFWRVTNANDMDGRGEKLFRLFFVTAEGDSPEFSSLKQVPCAWNIGNTSREAVVPVAFRNKIWIFYASAEGIYLTKFDVDANRVSLFECIASGDSFPMKQGSLPAVVVTPKDECYVFWVSKAQIYYSMFMAGTETFSPPKALKDDIEGRAIDVRDGTSMVGIYFEDSVYVFWIGSDGWLRCTRGIEK